MQKFISNSRGRASFNAISAKTGFYSLKKIGKNNCSAYSLTDLNRDVITTAPTSGVNRTGIFPVTKGNTRNTSPNNCDIAPPSALGTTTAATPVMSGNSHQLNDSFNGKVSGNGNGISHNCHVVISLNDAANFSANVRRRSSSFREMAAVTPGAPHTAHGNQRRDHSPMKRNHHNGPHSSGPPNRRPEHCSLQHPTVYRRSSGVPHMSPTSHSVQMGPRQAGLDMESTTPGAGVNTPATIPMHRLRRAATDVRSVRTLPNLPVPSSSTTGTLATRPRTSGSSKLWPGDPNAIQSVRRERKKPEEMLSLVKNGEEARRMIRDTPVTCSRNCSKPDLLIELGRSYSDLPSLLPAIEKARHDMARREAASRDADPHADQFLEEVAKPMPVCQIQYGALRTLGGVRRNSVIV